MTKKYTTPEEDEEIKRLYRTGQYTYEKLGQMFHISKPSAINIVKGYPYSGDKLEFWRRVYREMAVNMDTVLKEIRSDILDCLVKHDTVNYAVLMRQEEYLLSFAEISPEELFQKLRQERNDIEQTAWGHLSDNNYTEFAYWQSLWHKVNRIIGDNHKNPWGELVDKSGAKGRAHSLKYYSNKDYMKFVHQCRNVTNNGIQISDNLYNELKYSITAPTGRMHKDPRQRLNDILNLLFKGGSPKRYKDWQSIYDSYASWYRSGLFRILWELNEKYLELEPLRPALLLIERHRMIDTEHPPRFKEVQEANKKG